MYEVNFHVQALYLTSKVFLPINKNIIGIIGIGTAGIGFVASHYLSFQEGDNSFNLFFKLSIITAITLGIHLFLSYLMKLKEVLRLQRYLKNFLKKLSRLFEEKGKGV